MTAKIKTKTARTTESKSERKTRTKAAAPGTDKAAPGKDTAAAAGPAAGRTTGKAAGAGPQAVDWAALRARRTTALDLALPDPLPDEIATLFEKCQAKLGLIPNVLVAYAHRPEKLAAFSAMYNDLMLGPSGLTKLEREMIAVLVSSKNACWYCQVAHGAAVRQYSGDPALGEAIVFNWRMADLEPRQRAMLAFAEKITGASHRIEEADRAALRAAGLTEEDIWDVAAVAAFFAMSNRMASAVGMQPNAEYHGMAR